MIGRDVSAGYVDMTLLLVPSMRTYGWVKTPAFSDVIPVIGLRSVTGQALGRD
jgi:hypothetical protein